MSKRAIRLLPCRALVACILVLAACSKNQEKTAASEAEGAGSTPVEVAPVTSTTVHAVVTAEGVVYPIRQANVVGKISAPVQRFFVQRGDHVRTGQLLATLEDRDLVAAAQESKELYAQAAATYENTTAATMPDDLTRAKSDYQAAQENLDASQKVYDSRVALFRQGALAQKLVEDAKVALVQAQSQMQTAKQHLESLQTVGRSSQMKSADAQMLAAKAHYASSEAQVSYAEVRSPISGVVSDRPFNIGEIASAGSPLVSIVDISRIVVRANVPVEAASKVRVGRRAQITGAGVTLQGKVTVVSPAVDPSATTIQIWVEAANPQETLKLGTTVQVAIETSDIPDATVVPTAALLSSEDGGQQVMVAGSDSLAHLRKVEVGVRTPDAVQILSGVKPGEQVITSGALGLDDKAKITVSKPGAEDKDEKDDKGKDDKDKDK